MATPVISIAVEIRDSACSNPRGMEKLGSPSGISPTYDIKQTKKTQIQIYK